MSVRLYIGNLPKELEREEFEKIFSEHSEDLVSVKLISDKKTGKCRGFGFVTVKTDEKADELVNQFNGYQVNEEFSLKVEKALPRTKAKSDSSNNDAGEGNSSRRRSNKGSGGGRKSSSPSSTSAAQPDPRWASELEKLKELLATQTSST